MMISTRSLYNADLDYYRRSERGLQMAVGPNSSLPDHCTSSNSSQRQSPSLELEPKSSQRKRVPVACDRCRKRKIKCSGDEGEGQGCLNCRNAGWDSCQFLRVQSFAPAINTAALDGGRPWPSTSRYHPYSQHSNRSSSHIHTQAAYPPPSSSYSMWTTPAEYGQCPPPVQPSAYTRPSYASQYPLPFSNEPSYAYSNSAPPSYMLPDPQQIQHLNFNFAMHRSQQQQQPIWQDQVMQNNGHITNTFSVALGEGQPAYTTLVQPTANVSPTQRLLPAFSSSRMVPSVPLTANDTPPLSATSHRSSIGWHTETASNASAASSQTSCSGQPDASTSFSNPSCSVQELAYSYSGLPVATQPGINPPILRIPNDELQVGRLTHGLRGMPGTQQRYEGISYESAGSSCPDSPSYTYPYNESNLQGHRNSAGTNSRHVPMVDSRVWTDPEDLRGDPNEDCKHET